jgi:hypothetical protein
MYEISGNVAYGQNILDPFVFSARGAFPQGLEGENIVVPADQFLWDKRVLDEVAYVWKGNMLVTVGTTVEVRLPRPGCLVVSLESPHRSEYFRDFEPKGPLRDEGSRQNLITFLPELILGIGGIAEDTEIVLCNPVPYQASLDRIMAKASGLHKTTRNVVWRGLFRGGFREDFLARLELYRPSVVLQACTYALKDECLKAIKELKERQGANVFRLHSTQHPCWWHVKHVLKP